MVLLHAVPIYGFTTYENFRFEEGIHAFQTDLLVCGAEPLFFLDYYATGHLNVDVAANVVTGIGKGCELAGCALVGGETAEHPGLMPEDEYDLAGFAVGVVDRKDIITGEGLKDGDVLIGMASTGVHSNGFSLVRKLLLEKLGMSLEDDFQGKKLKDVLLEPTRIYVKEFKANKDKINALSPYLLVGDEDEYITEQTKLEVLKGLDNAGITFSHIFYKGGHAILTEPLLQLSSYLTAP